MDNLTPEQRRKNMRNIKSKDTKPEILLRRALYALGIRYRLHGKLYQEGISIPKTNQEYWIPKLEKNILRDIEVNDKLKKCHFH